ncbi:MAG: NeuD/PglB/VioB family sugar acetyltransferase [Saprospiraceae bacterium]|nr:NeuD/PglB/VioB family sugar acetyltransferase [Saprospiraceae bacterium]MCB0623881.1 NeuD/PglB/VioB family sugar acetyltransferase [Saprospiraceae bacterium]MCB0678812.1 NeuD/PglB/VioB family sugar acetyltransferase [Saprospiraceae bacterium]MCB0680321.1 NeuD/PglB/VioB family sugar acetyltransferase [Saprospiraceae bacterium]
MNKKICIVGTGGFAKEILWLIDDIGRFAEVECFMEPDHEWSERTIMDKPVRPQSEFDPGVHTAVIGIGHPQLREKVVHQLPAGTTFETLVHPNSYVTRWSTLGEGCVVCAGSVVSVHAVLGKHVQVNCYSTIGHDCQIGDYNTTTAAVSISGDCIVGKHVYWGNGSTIRQGLTVCDEVMIGMGAVVSKNITESGVYVGIPAQKMGK